MPMPTPLDTHASQPSLKVYGVMILVSCCIPALLAMILG